MGKVIVKRKIPRHMQNEHSEHVIAVIQYVIDKKPGNKKMMVYWRIKACKFVAQNGKSSVTEQTVREACTRRLGWEKEEGSIADFDAALWDAYKGDSAFLHRRCMEYAKNEDEATKFDQFFREYFSNEPETYTEDDKEIGPHNDGPGWVYIVVNPLFDGWVKIGCTRNHNKRIRNFQTYAPVNYDMVHKHHSTELCYRDEQKVHKKLEERGIEKHREWFKMPVEDAWDAINSYLGSRKTSSILDLVE